GASALAVLRRLAGLLEAVLLPLLGPRVTGQEADLLQRRTVIGVDLHQRAGDRQAQRARLAADAAAAEVAEDVEAVGLLDGLQRLADQLLVHLVREVLLERAAVELELAAAGNQTHPHHGFLPAPNGLRAATGGTRRAGRGWRLASEDGREVLAASRGLGGGQGFLAQCALTCAALLIWNGWGGCAACGCPGPAYTISFLACARPSVFFGSMPFT